MKAPTDFDDAVAKLRAHEKGNVSQRDYFPGGSRPPYRMACLTLDVEHADAATAGMAMTALTVETHGYLTVSVHEDHANLTIHLTRNLTSDEIGEEPPCASREVAEQKGLT